MPKVGVPSSLLTCVEKHKTWQEHLLWVQLRQASSDRAACKALYKAWDVAVANAENAGTRSRQEIREEAIKRALLWGDRIAEKCDTLSQNEREVMWYVISETERRRITRVTCSARAVADRAKMPIMTAYRTLDMLTIK